MVRTLVIWASVASCCAAPAARAERYGWPLDAERRLSSSFMEYRDGHYHAGIDLRTYGQIGLPCLAIDRCDAARVRVSSTGYGKALYVRLQDGNTAVYAHLNGFSRGLDSLVYHRRLERGTSTCDMSLDPGLFTFEKGEIVAFSGNTGSPHPHLHFEMRDSAGRPFNPLESLYDVPDECDPIISGLEVVPLSWGSRVNGSPLPVTSRFRRVRGGTYEIRDTLRLDGEFGFGVSAYDKQMMGSYRMGPSTVELRIDGALAYRVRNESFDYAQTNDILLDYEERRGDAPGRYLVLHEKGARSMPGREGSGVVRSRGKAADVPFVEPGVRRGEIIVRDAAGNEARGIFFFLLNAFPEAAVSIGAGEPPQIMIAPADPDGGSVSADLHASLDEGKSWRPIDLTHAGERYEAVAAGERTTLYRLTLRDDEGSSSDRYFAAPPFRDERDSVLCDVRAETRSDGLLITFTADRPLAAVPTVSLGAAGSGDTLLVIPLGARVFVALAPPERLASGMTVLGIRGRDLRGFPLEVIRAFQIVVLESGEQSSFNAAEGIAVRFRAPAVRGRAVVLLGQVALPEAGSAGLEFVAPPFSIDFAPASFARPLQCDIAAGEKTGLYRSNGRRAEWRWIGGSGSEMFALGRPGTYAVMRDARAPELKKPASVRSMPGSGFFKRRLHYVGVHEEGSGVDPGSALVFIDGARGVCEWDGYRGRLEIPVPCSRTPGPARLRVELADRAGNRSAGEFDVVIE